MTRTTSDNPDFVNLVASLDAELAERDGEQEHAFYDQFNKTNNLPYVVLSYRDNRPVGCGSLKEHESGALEIKRMYVLPEWRGKGIAAEILSGLENWAREMSYTQCILETGKRQIEAINFYKKSGYTPIPNYGQYIGVDNSLCFGKQL